LFFGFCFRNLRLVTSQFCVYRVVISDTIPSPFGTIPWNIFFAIETIQINNVIFNVFVFYRWRYYYMSVHFLAKFHNFRFNRSNLIIRMINFYFRFKLSDFRLRFTWGNFCSRAIFFKLNSMFLLRFTGLIKIATGISILIFFIGRVKK